MFRVQAYVDQALYTASNVGGTWSVPIAFVFPLPPFKRCIVLGKTRQKNVYSLQHSRPYIERPVQIYIRALLSIAYGCSDVPQQRQRLKYGFIRLLSFIHTENDIQVSVIFPCTSTMACSTHPNMLRRSRRNWASARINRYSKDAATAIDYQSKSAIIDQGILMYCQHPEPFASCAGSM